MASLAKVLKVLDVEIAKNTNQSDFFQADSVYIPTGHTYGGQFLGQSVISAAKTTSEFRQPSSIHAYFMEGGQLSEKLDYRVDRLRDGVKFSHREVTAFQGDRVKPIFKSMISFHEEEDSEIDFTSGNIPDVPKPDKVPDISEVFAPFDGKNEWSTYFVNEMPLEIRQISPSLFMGSDKRGIDAQELVWTRIRPSDIAVWEEFCSDKSDHQIQLFQRALLVFISDQFAFSPALRKAGLSWLNKDAQYVSLDHAQYFHRDVDLTKWNLYVGDSPAGANARGLGVTVIFNEDGDIVSTVAQEGSIRVAS